MIYVMSDIHGLYKQYRQMLETIEFSDGDTLYVIGDVVDFGPQPMEILQDMSMRPNVIPILGNHEYVAHDTLSKLMFELTEENLRKHFGNDLMNFVRFISSWRDIGGGSTLEQFGKLGQDGREQIIEYLKEFSLYEIVEVVGRTFVLTHAGLPDGATLDNLGEFDAYDFATAKIDYKKQYFDDAFLVTGHIPTMSINRSSKGKVWRKNNHIAIDAGAAFGGALACVCLDTDEEFYVESR